MMFPVKRFIPLKALCRRALLGGLVALGGQVPAEELEIVHSPVKIWGAHEMGMLQSGIFADANTEFTDEWIDNFGSGISKDVLVNDNIRLSVGIAGIFRFPKPERPAIKFGGSQAVWYFVGPSVAEASYTFLGDRESPVLELSGGLFPYQYNPDAYNLGGYLFRSTAYPTTVTSGGLMTIGSTSVPLQGLKLGFTQGNFHTDLLVTTETTFPPFYDLSVSVFSDYKIAGGLVELGAGVALRRLVPMFADSTTPNIIENGYFKDSTGQYIGGLSSYYKERASYLLSTVPDLGSVDSALVTFQVDSLRAIGTVLDDLKNRTAGGENPQVFDSLGVQFYTNKNISLMFRLAFDFKKLFDSNLFSHQDLRLYGEVNVLGFKNYPIFYEDRTERMPLMAGFNFPTFKLLDLLALQVEYFKSPYLNNHINVGNGNMPQPRFMSDPVYSEGEFYSVTKENNLYWSVMFKKEFLPGISFSGQVGRDHMRASSPGYFYGSREDPNEVFVRGQDWYWAFQLAWGL